MHEMAIAQGILDIVLTTAARHGAVKVGRIRVLAGEMTQVVPESLEFGFTAVAAGSIAQDARLEVITVPLEGKCGRCGRQFRIQRFSFVCSYCGSANVEIVAGRELMVDLLEVE